VHQPSSSRIARAPVDASDRRAAREALLTRRTALAADARADADREIRARLARLVATLAPAPRVVAGYWAMRGEPDLGELLAAWHEEGLEVALPRVAAAAAPLEFGRWRPGAVLAAGAFGTRHPEPHDALVPDVIVLPCLGFDALCHRLGYGGGYYDRTLARLPGARAIGVAYDECEIVGFEPQPYDRGLDAVVTQRRALLRPGGRVGSRGRERLE